MKPYIDKSLIAAAGFAATMGIVGMSWLAYAGVAQTDKATDDDVLTAEQCIDNNTTNGSVEPFEEALIREGIVNTELDKLSITRGMCDETIERTPGGSPIARAVALGNLTQELQIIKKSMEEAADKDVNGDGSVNAEDAKIARSASYAASHAAQKVIRAAIDEELGQIGVIEEISP